MDAEKGRVRKRGRGKHEDLAAECFSQRFIIILEIKTCFNNSAGTERVREKADERHAEAADKTMTKTQESEESWSSQSKALQTSQT